MEFKKAIVKSIRAYFKGEGLQEYTKESKKFKYSKKYFDNFEMNEFGSVMEFDLYE